MTAAWRARSRPAAALAAALLGAAALTACSGLAPFVPRSGQPRTYYVSPSGSDSAAGTSPGTAWRTLRKASSVPLPPGSRLLLQGGRQFTGPLTIGSRDAGDAADPVSIGSYGTGAATIRVSSGDALLVHDTGGVNIADLDLAGTPGPGDGDGIDLYSDLPAGRRLSHVDIRGVEAAGFMIGIAVSGRNPGAGFSGVTITGSSVHGNTDAGIAAFGPPFTPAAPAYANSDITISHVTAEGNPGNPADRVQNTGSGIVLGSVRTAVVSWSVAADNGGAGAAEQGPGGIWAYDSTGVDIEHDVSYGNKTRDRSDGNGFGLDQNTSYSELQYDFSYGNDGSGFLVYSSVNDGAQRHNTVRDDISSDDARNGNPFYSALSVVGDVADVAVYQNTAVMRPTADGSPPVLRLSADLRNVTVANNVFATASGPVVATTAALPRSSVFLAGNDYYAASGPWQILWGTAVYRSLGAWRATGQETFRGRPVGMTAAPLLSGPVSGLPPGTPALPAAARGFEPEPGSALLGAGLAPAALGLAPTAFNYLGQPQSAQHPDVGAL